MAYFPFGKACLQGLCQFWGGLNLIIESILVPKTLQCQDAKKRLRCLGRFQQPQMLRWFFSTGKHSNSNTSIEGRTQVPLVPNCTKYSRLLVSSIVKIPSYGLTTTLIAIIFQLYNEFCIKIAQQVISTGSNSLHSKKHMVNIVRAIQSGGRRRNGGNPAISADLLSELSKYMSCLFLVSTLVVYETTIPHKTGGFRISIPTYPTNNCQGPHLRSGDPPPRLASDANVRIVAWGNFPSEILLMSFDVLPNSLKFSQVCKNSCLLHANVLSNLMFLGMAIWGLNTNSSGEPFSFFGHYCLMILARVSSLKIWVEKKKGPKWPIWLPW